MEVVEAKFIKEFMRLCDDGWKLGWHEYHGGNLTYRIKLEEIEQIRDKMDCENAVWVTMDKKFPNLANEYFVVTGSGECFRNAMVRPIDNFGIVEIDDKGEAYRVLWGLEANGKRPTSEFMPHLSIHSIKKDRSGELYRIVYHSHPANIIVISAVMEHDSTKITRALWDMEPECPMTFPKGIGILDWAVPGTVELANQTGELMKKYDVVLWSSHGVLIAGIDFDATLGVAHTIEKSAEMLLKIMMVSQNNKYKPTDNQYRELAKVFHLDLPEEYVNSKE